MASSATTLHFTAPDSRMPTSRIGALRMNVVLTTYGIPDWRGCQRPITGRACQKTGRPHPAGSDSEGTRMASEIDMSARETPPRKRAAKRKSGTKVRRRARAPDQTREALLKAAVAE